MSWLIDIIGKTEDVRAAVVAANYIPQQLKDGITTIMDTGTGPDAYDKPPGAFRVRSAGHYDPRGSSNIYYLEVNPITLAVPPPTPSSSSSSS